jgi:hypothetical protein
MNLGSYFLVAATLAFSSAALAGNNGAYAARGYRWVIVNGPYACNDEQDAERITKHHTDAAELDLMQSIRCYYLIPGTIVKVIKEDPSRGMSQIVAADIRRPLWTYTRFLSKHPIPDLYGVIETPESSGLLSTAHTTQLPLVPPESSAARLQPNGFP